MFQWYVHWIADHTGFAQKACAAATTGGLGHCATNDPVTAAVTNTANAKMERVFARKGGTAGIAHYVSVFPNETLNRVYILCTW